MGFNVQTFATAKEFIERHFNRACLILGVMLALIVVGAKLVQRALAGT